MTREEFENFRIKAVEAQEHLYLIQAADADEIGLADVRNLLLNWASERRATLQAFRQHAKK